MTQTTLPATTLVTTIRRRAFFGMFDADGWAWAGVKAALWFVLIIILLGYIPDRAYYLTVQRTVDIGVLGWSPVNLCPPENETLPCPAPQGATLPWHPAPAELQFPAARTDGAAAVVGSTFLYTGGSDGKAAVATTYVSHAVGTGNFDVWAAGPALPEARTDAASVVLGNTLYLLGGYGPDGKPTTTVYSLTVANDGTLGEWKLEDGLVLPEPRAGAAAAPVSDGIVVLGGTDGTAPTKSIWKTQVDATGAFAAWVPQGFNLYEENMDGVAVHVGDVVFLVGGSNAKGPSLAVQQAVLGGPTATVADPNIVSEVRVSEQTNLPEARTNLSGFTANGVIYIQGGADATGPRAETWWTSPDANGVITAWNRLRELDLGEGVSGSSSVSAGSHAFMIGGTTAGGASTGAARVNLAPQEPFFQLGLLGATVPALRLQGEIGQQIGYLNAAGVGTVNFVLLLLVGWGFAHKERVREILAKRRKR